MKKLIPTLAIALLLPALPLFADDLVPHLKTTRQLIHDGKYKEALDEIESALNTFPGSARLYKLRGNIHFLMKNYQAALTDMNTVVKLHPNAAKPYIDRAVVYLAMKNYAAAEADIDHALKIKPNSAYAIQVKSKIDQLKAGAAK